MTHIFKIVSVKILFAAVIEVIFFLLFKTAAVFFILRAQAFRAAVEQHSTVRDDSVLENGFVVDRWHDSENFLAALTAVLEISLLMIMIAILITATVIITKIPLLTIVIPSLAAILEITLLAVVVTTLITATIVITEIPLLTIVIPSLTAILEITLLAVIVAILITAIVITKITLTALMILSKNSLLARLIISLLEYSLLTRLICLCSFRMNMRFLYWGFDRGFFL